MAKIMEKRMIAPFPLLFKGKGRDRVKLRKGTFKIRRVVESGLLFI
jgi:hypothetical protein